MATTVPDYTVNYNDSRLTNVTNEKNQQISNINNSYSDMINKSDSYYNDLIKTAEDYGTQQSEAQQKRAEYEQQVVENQKSDAQKQYEKEQRASYVDYQNQINPYGSEARRMADTGVDSSGYGITAQTSMYNAYQNRVSLAKESFNTAIRDYDMAIKDIQLQNDSKLMEITYNALQSKLELALQSFTARNELLQAQMDRTYQYETLYENKYQNVLSQINTENALAEKVREYNESMAYDRERDAVSDAQWQKTYELQKKSLKSSGGSGGNGGNNQDTSALRNSTNNYGNDSNVTSKDNYYWDYKNDGNKGNDFQPRYVNNHLLTAVKEGKTQVTAGDILKPEVIKNLQTAGYGVISSNKVFYENGNYWVWTDKTHGYLPVTAEYNNYKNS